MKCAGEVKIGIALGFIKLKDNTLIDKLLFDCLPSSLTKIAGQEALGETEEKITRAKFLSSALKGVRIK
jgi:protein-arginine kinase